MSGGSNDSAKKFFQTNGLVDFYWGLGGPGAQGSFGFYGMGGGTQGRPARVNYPAECYLPVHTVRYDGERVIDFSNPRTIQLERERALHSGSPARRRTRAGRRWILRIGGTNGRDNSIRI